ncbi:hypothetical protein TUM12151_15410 [Morganella morganii]|nr:hypothetical protein TUM12149_00060 [Morganella morganii]GIZ30571.1 hypothetical protein TUM12150_10570 [Morganella morganii]GIZ34555.1 hypothetical protein TUM12151_15410 [Morganella morganii]
MPFTGQEGEKNTQMKYVLISIDRRSVNVYSASVKGEHYEPTSLFCCYHRDLPGHFYGNAGYQYRECGTAGHSA